MEISLFLNEFNENQSAGFIGIRGSICMHYGTVALYFLSK
jgi:hypothetical protein